MPSVLFSSLLFFCRVVVGLCLLCAVMFSFQLLGRTWTVAQDGPTEVRLQLDVMTPNLFSALYDMKAGWQDGSNNKPHRPQRGPLPALMPEATSFVLAADQQMPLLRYNEPNPWKRVALLHLGASDNLFSLALVVFLSVGSWQMWCLLIDVTPATPFTRANGQRLSKLALLVLGLNLTESLSYLALRGIIPVFNAPGLAEPLSHYVRLSTENSLPNPWVGIILAVIAVVYRRGVELSREAELTI